MDGIEKCRFATHGIPLLALVGFHPRSSLVFMARCLSSSATVSSAICTCFSMSLMVSSEALSFDFFTLFIALVRIFRNESLALFVFCLASFTSISLCSRVTLIKDKKKSSIKSSHGALEQGHLTSGKLAIFTSISCGDFMEIWLIWLRASFPSAVTTVILSRDPKRKIRIRIQKDFYASITDFISSSTSSKLMISSTKAVLRFILVWDCPFPLARKSTFNEFKRKKNRTAI
uniref:Uncharacterized protein n=1 Tax=Capra hircus TaxID=9925 RepID=A0A8C2PN86_CAPHI